ncbi:hypothetical protein SLEP1_g14108 [Rubroshorea leprosula]|uniref:NB-ARC domain-containing protein n=1 Tax=Rubroshorea leprosula TaxID=152421 RepID=A0AAV5ISF7_9ROSI|nr:hypothetical protein SLEP1_g14108 [Rubroshorea leprosula]
MANKIRNLITSIDDINEEARQYNLQSRLAVSAPESRSNPQTAHPFLGYCSQVIGREDDVSNLVDLLIDPSNKQPLSVISVVGMGGLGKTTLVKSVEKEEKIREHFGKIMSICVSEDFNVKRILKNMLECLSKESCSIKSESAIMKKIKEKLENKNYLLILDDVWNENESMKWEELRGCLSEINKNKVSRVVVTTRSTKVASTMGTRDEHVYHLKQLKQDECWSIIKQRVFGDSSVPDQELEQIGRQIAKKCRGVPLVANIIGASLSTRIHRHEWLSVQNSEAWDSLKDDSTGRGILGVLQSSFDRLPDPALKKCFAFCSIFPKDYFSGVVSRFTPSEFADGGYG